MESKSYPARKLNYEQKAINIAYEFRNQEKPLLDRNKEEILSKSLLGKLVSARLKLRTNPIRACQKFHNLADKTQDSRILFEEAVAKMYCARLAREERAKLNRSSKRKLNEQLNKKKEAEEIMKKIATKEYQAAGYLLFKFFKEGASISKEVFMYGIYSAAFGSVAEKTKHLPDLDKQDPDRKLRPSQRELTLLSGKEILEIIRLLVIANREKDLVLTDSEKDMLLKPFNYLISICKLDEVWKAEKWEYLCANLFFSHEFINPDLSKEFKKILHGMNSPFLIQE